MKRAALRVAQPPGPEEPAPRLADVVQPLLDAAGTGKLLGGISAHQVDRLRQRAGLPAVDLSIGTPGRRAKGLYRFDPVAVRSWWQTRQRGGTA